MITHITYVKVCIEALREINYTPGVNVHIGGIGGGGVEMRFGRSELTGEQIRAARALLRMAQADLARHSKLSLETIKRLERTHGVVEANSRTLAALGEAFDELGVVFDAYPDGLIGVCWQPPGTPAAGAFAGRQAPAGRPREPELYRLLYFSTATEQGRIEEAVDDIRDVSTRRNSELDVTGALFACDGHFLQILEGAKDAVLRIYGSISCDPRHQSLRLLELRPIATRQFPDWALVCGVFSIDDEALAQEPALRDGFNPDSLSPATALGLLSIVRELYGSSRAPGPAAGVQKPA